MTAALFLISLNALLIGVTAHLGGLLVWGTDFFNS